MFTLIQKHNIWGGFITIIIIVIIMSLICCVACHKIEARLKVYRSFYTEREHKSESDRDRGVPTWFEWCRLHQRWTWIQPNFCSHRTPQRLPPERILGKRHRERISFANQSVGLNFIQFVASSLFETTLSWKAKKQKRPFCLSRGILLLMIPVEFINLRFWNKLYM
jgi:hypothetical protein